MQAVKGCVKVWAISVNRLFAYCKGGNFNIISGRGSTISSAKEGKSGFIYNLVKNSKSFGPRKRATISWKS